MSDNNSTSKYDPSTDPKRKAKSNDPGWKYGFWPIIGNSDLVECTPCGEKDHSDVKSLKQHLSGLAFKDATCPNTTKEIREEIQEALNNKRGAPRVQLDNEKAATTNMSSDPVPSSGTAAKKTRATFFQSTKPNSTQRKSVEEVVDERHTKSSIHTTMECNTRTKEEHDQVYEYIAKFFYENGIPFNAANSRSYEYMIEAIGRFGPELKPPSYHELQVPLLEKTKKKTDEIKKKHENAWEQYGCTLMSDGWRDKRGRHLINFLANSPEGTFFLGSVIASSQPQSQDATMLADLLEEMIHKIGKNKVVQVVTDNSANFKEAGHILESRFPTIFWTPCAAHCIDSMLEDIGKLKEFEPSITKARTITTFIYRHQRLLDAAKQCIGMDIVKTGVTKFATAYLTLSSLYRHRVALRHLFVHDDWAKSKLARTEIGKRVYEIVLSTRFWNGVQDCIKASYPLLIVLRIVDSDKNPAMPEIVAAMDYAKNKIKESFEGGSQIIYNKVMNIINERWTRQMEQSLYDAALFLNPSKFFAVKENDMIRAAKIRMKFNEVLQKMILDEELVEVISDQANDYQNMRGGFEGKNVVKHLTTMSPLDWWGCYGGRAIDLCQFAIRIIGLCCKSSGCERNWSTFEFIHTKKRNHLEHQRLTNLVYVQYNQKIETRFKKQCEEGEGFDPLVLDDFQSDNEWINVDGDLVHPCEDLWWQGDDKAKAASRAGRSVRRDSILITYSRRGRGVSTLEKKLHDYNAADETEKDSMDPIMFDDEDVEDDYGIESPPSEHSDDQGCKDFDFGY